MVYKCVFLQLALASFLNCSEPVLTKESGYLDISPGKVFYQKFYTDKSKGKTPLLVINGGPGYSHNHMLGIKDLGYTRPVIFYDQMGTGKSSPLDQQNWTFDYYFAELKSLVSALNLQKFDLLGHSWGGALGIEYALKFPENLNKLILSGPLLDAQEWKKYTSGLVDKLVIPSGASKKEAFGAAHVLRRTDLPQDIKNSLNPAAPGVYNKDIYVTMLGPSEFEITGNLNEWTRLQKLKDIKTPTLFIAGDHDEANPKLMQDVAQKMPNAEVEIIKDASHLTFIENPEEYMRIVNRFLA